jgi:cell division protein FtsQ
LQQVGARGFAAAQLVDPRQLPVPLPAFPLRGRFDFGRAWVLHKKLMLRAAAAGIVIVVVASLYEARDDVGALGQRGYALAQTQIARAGFGISTINITGQTLTGEATILRALAIAPDTTTLSYDADAALQRLGQIPTIKSANIRKVYPNGLAVTVVEKVPAARWRIGDKTYVVDEDGSPVAVDDGSFKSLPLVVGEGAAAEAMVMIHALNAYPALTEDLAALSRIGDRRWDLIFYSGLRVELPENGVAQALQQLDMYQRQDQLLDRDLQVVDMRVPGMLSLKLGDLANQAWATFKKQNKHVTTGDSEYETAAERASGTKAQ